MVTWGLVACALAVVVPVTACTPRPPTPAGAAAAADSVLIVKDIYDEFDQPTHSGVPRLCKELNDSSETVDVVGSLDASTRNISDRTQRSPFSIPFLIDDALEDARHAECHWSPLATPQHFKISVEMTVYQNTPATRYARSAFAKIINDSKDENLAYEKVALGSAACVASSGQTYYGVLRKDNVLMTVTISTPQPIPAEWSKTVSTSPAYAMLSVLNEKFGSGTGAPKQSPDKHDDCS